MIMDKGLVVAVVSVPILCGLAFIVSASWYFGKVWALRVLAKQSSQDQGRGNFNGTSN